VDVLNLMDKSTDTYSKHEQEIQEVNTELLKIVEYEKHRPNNDITIRMWNILIGTDSTGKIDDKRLIPSFWAKWKKDGTERAVFIEQAKLQVAEGFDLIAELEAKKIKASDSNVQTFISNNQ
jgi:hypothetical protein